MSGRERSARRSDPIRERGGAVGRGAVLYDVRDPDRRPCCRQGGRCLAHVTGVYEETTTGEVYFRVEDGTHTTREWVYQDDLLALFEPAGWSVLGYKPTYLLTRENGVEDHHDLMTDGGTVDDDEPKQATLLTDGGTAGTERRRIHFLTDVRDLGVEYECKRCGHVTASKVEMNEHRKGMIPHCFRVRLKQKWRSLRTDTDRSGGDGDAE